MAKKLQIPWCAVTDEDLLADGTINPATARVRANIALHKTAVDDSFIWPGSLEACFGLAGGQKPTSVWQVANLEALAVAELDARYPCFTDACRSIQGWLYR
jgi:hypothetical protein